MKICFVCDEYPPGAHGGIGTFTQVLGRGLVDAGHSVRVIGTYAGDGTPAGRPESDRGVQVTRLRPSTGTLGWIRDRISLWRTIDEWARRDEIDLVEVPDYLGPAAGWPRIRVPIVVRLHSSATVLSSELGRPLNRRVRLLESRSLRRADALVSVSRYTAVQSQRQFGIQTADCAVSHVPIEPMPAVAGTARQPGRVAFVGKLTVMKGIVTLFRAWKLVREAGVDAQLHIYAGDRPGVHGSSMRRELLGLLPPATVPSVVFHGQVARERVLAELPLATCAVFPSYTESFGYAPLEAMAAGCATIFTTRACGPELITHGQNGVLVDPDDPRGLADALLALLADPSLARRLGESGRVRSERFAVPRIASEQLAFFESVLERRRVWT